MPHRLTLALCLIVLVLPTGRADADGGSTAINGCLSCHIVERTGFNTAHNFAANDCAACHAGNPVSRVKHSAHEELIRFPGEMATAERACGGCHANRVTGVLKNLMHTGRGIVRVTRQVIDGTSESLGNDSLQSLGYGVADSMLRKQCASCHLGQPKTMHSLDVTRDRGGGCLACHINDYPDTGHPALTTRVEDGRCFGCHSRSGRISLSYAGLAETEPPPDSDGNTVLRLADGRPVERLPADAHYLAGMGCIDCHTSLGLMGDADDARRQRDAVDIACSDCHDNRGSPTDLSDWPPDLASMRKHVPFSIDAETQFLATRSNGTPLWNIELRDDAAWLHTKNTGRKLRIPRAKPAHSGHDPEHQRVTCSACHSQWAPQCFGCHMEFDPRGEQWDHVDRKITAGRWSDRRWHIDNGLPALGVNDHGKIDVFVPGMIMTIAHPSLQEDKFVRHFAPLSPHTTGPARSCSSCHRSSKALGLGEGEVEIVDDSLSFVPRHGSLRDGLPADAWTSIGNSRDGQAPFAGRRPLNSSEMKTILEAGIAAGEPAGD